MLIHLKTCQTYVFVGANRVFTQAIWCLPKHLESWTWYYASNHKTTNAYYYASIQRTKVNYLDTLNSMSWKYLYHFPYSLLPRCHLKLPTRRSLKTHNLDSYIILQLHMNKKIVLRFFWERQPYTHILEFPNLCVLSRVVRVYNITLRFN